MCLPIAACRTHVRTLTRSLHNATIHNKQKLGDELDMRIHDNVPEPNHIYEGDCLEIIRQWPDACVDHCIADPPFGIALSGWAAHERHPSNSSRSPPSPCSPSSRWPTPS